MERKSLPCGTTRSAAPPPWTSRSEGTLVTAEGPAGTRHPRPESAADTGFAPRRGPTREAAAQQRGNAPSARNAPHAPSAPAPRSLGPPSCPTVWPCPDPARLEPRGAPAAVSHGSPSLSLEAAPALPRLTAPPPLCRLPSRGPGGPLAYRMTSRLGTSLEDN